MTLIYKQYAQPLLPLYPPQMTPRRLFTLQKGNHKETKKITEPESKEEQN